MWNNLKIAISGRSGCGNTSVTRIVAEKLGLKMINYTFHDMAREKGIPFEELCSMAEKDTQYDYFLDEKQVKLAEEGGCVLGSRLAVWLLKDADLKVFLTAPPEERARRIAVREDRSLQESMEKTVARDKRDHERFMMLYEIDNNKFDFVDMVIDTSRGDQYWVADQIIKAIEGKK